jgi:hypothetical protein
MLDVAGLYDALDRYSLTTRASAQARVITMYDGVLTSFIAADEKYQARLIANSTKDSNGNTVEPTDPAVKRKVAQPFLDWYVANRVYFGLHMAAIAPDERPSLPEKWQYFVNALNNAVNSAPTGKAPQIGMFLNVTDGYPIVPHGWINQVSGGTLGNIKDLVADHNATWGTVAGHYEDEANLSAVAGFQSIKYAAGTGDYAQFVAESGLPAGLLAVFIRECNNLLMAVSMGDSDLVPVAYPEIIIEITSQIYLLIRFIVDEVCVYAGHDPATFGAIGSENNTTEYYGRLKLLGS